MKRKVDINVFGSTFTIRTDESEEHVKELEKFVNDKFNEIRAATRSVSSFNIAILVALNVSNLYLKDKKKWEEKEKRLKQLAEKIEDVLRCS